MSELLTGIYIVAAVVFLFGAAVFFHELGHFVVARLCGMKVVEFAIGFGPKIFGRRRNGIDYSWRWIPAGGYVKLPQMITSEALEGKGDEEQVPPAPPLSKIMVAFAGPMMNVIFAFVIATVIYFVGLPVLVNPSFIGKMDPDSAEYKMGIREGDRIVEVNGTPVKSWQEVNYETVTARTNVLPVVIERAGERKTYYLTAKASDAVGLKWLNLDPREHPIVGYVDPGSPAKAAGLEQGDRIVSFGGVPVMDQGHLVDLVAKAKGKPTEIVVERDHKDITSTVTPHYDSGHEQWRIGIGFSGGTYEVQRPGPTPWAQCSKVIRQTVGTFSALLHSHETGVKPSDLSGPVGILSILAVQVKTDYRLALSFMVLLNINLAILNLLPVPVLDGGHILMAIIEGIRRRPLNVKFVEYTTTAFAIVLISFMLYVTIFGDLKRFSIFRGMFSSPVQVEQPANSPPSQAPAKAD